MATETKTFYPGAYKADSNNYYGMKNATNPVGKGSANTTHASFENRPYQSGIVYWPFDTSIIPAEATIDSVACMAKGSCNSSTKGSMQLYSGTVAKGSATSTKTSAAVYNLSCGTWTRAELDNIRLLTKITNTNSNRSIFYFYGADLTVTYTYKNEKFMLKLGGSWADASRVFKKVDGIWVEQTDLSSVIPGNVRYQNGGEYVPPVKTVTITGQGWINSGNTFLGVVINGVTYTQPATVEVDAGTVIQVLSVGEVYLNGSVVVAGGESIYSHTVNENCTINLEINFNTYSAKATITTE